MSRGMRALAGVLAAGLVLLAGAGGSQAAAPKFPALTGRVVDEAHILPAATVSDLTVKLQGLEAKTSRQLVVVTVPSLQGYEIEEFGYQLGRAWGLGQKALDNGALFIVAPTERKVRIEVGYGLEGVLTDALSSVILQARVLPRFKVGDMPGGVVAGTDALVEQLSLDPSTAEQRAVEAAAAQAGARSSAPEPVAIVFIILFVLWMLRALLAGGRRRRAGLGGLLAPIIFSSGGGRSWGGGGGGGGGFGGGGFGGGGGSFGGGGSSGSW